jgi:hypothetical protein
LLRGTNGRFACAKDEIDIGLDDCGCMVCKLVDAQPKTVIVDDEILPIDEAVHLHRVEKCGIVRRISRAEMQVTEAIDPARLLRPSRERP